MLAAVVPSGAVKACLLGFSKGISCADLLLCKQTCDTLWCMCTRAFSCVVQGNAATAIQQQWQCSICLHFREPIKTKRCCTSAEASLSALALSSSEQATGHTVLRWHRVHTSQQQCQIQLDFQDVCPTIAAIMVTGFCQLYSQDVWKLAPGW